MRNDYIIIDKKTDTVMSVSNNKFRTLVNKPCETARLRLALAGYSINSSASKLPDGRIALFFHRSYVTSPSNKGSDGDIKSKIINYLFITLILISSLSIIQKDNEKLFHLAYGVNSILGLAVAHYFSNPSSSKAESDKPHIPQIPFSNKNQLK